ncbi:PQQ-binding-like beta-propeller repeat protein [Nocardia sp. NPDC101769]|uniref:PQQ-binding-like beta-propeller repeat protein n=1 Tax=Nocardia sp. NPDC101769 TaxID=3364333 RepID=UPI00382B8FEA
MSGDDGVRNSEHDDSAGALLSAPVCDRVRRSGHAAPGDHYTPGGHHRDLDGAVYGQPIVAGGTVFAATENDSVYAIADGDGLRDRRRRRPVAHRLFRTSELGPGHRRRPRSGQHEPGAGGGPPRHGREIRRRLPSRSRAPGRNLLGRTGFHRLSRLRPGRGRE